MNVTFEMIPRMHVLYYSYILNLFTAKIIPEK